MPIVFDSEKRTFKLDTSNSSYVMEIFDGGHLVPLYSGAPEPDTDLVCLRRRETVCSSFSPKVDGVRDGSYAPDMSPMEFPTTGIGDYRLTAFSVESADGDNTTDLRYVSHKIYPGKPGLEGLPATYVNDEGEATTLELLLTDRFTGVDVVMYYTVFEKLSAMARSVKVINNGTRPVWLTKAGSACLNLPLGDYTLVHMHGKYCKEHYIERRPLGGEITTLASVRGSSGHNQNPFAAFAAKDSGEEYGEVYGVSFLYSGNFEINTYKDFFGATRVTVGINPEHFRWHLDPGEYFTVPETVTVYSDKGLGGMSRTFHRLYSKNLVRGEWRDKKRPLLINSWEATGMNINADKLIRFAEKAKSLGFDMLVMDDGWFGHRNDGCSSLGDWYVNEEKFPGGLAPMVEKINALGMKFGIWYEPEMISKNSDLYRAHPDWTMHSAERPLSEARCQLHVDMTRKEVRDHVFDAMYDVISKNHIDYIKWDMNRNFSEVFSRGLPADRQGELAHRYVLGTYELMERILTAFPHVLLESCSGGGGRYDAGILYYSPQVWTSDNTDGIDRESIQFGTSLCYPASSMGSHVSRHHRLPGTDGFRVKGDIALWGTFGYELDPTTFSEEDDAEVARQTANYHKYYDLIHNGDLYRLEYPDQNPCRCAWEFVSPDASEALLTVVVNLKMPVHAVHVYRLHGLDPEKYYVVEGYDGEGKDLVLSGAALMRAGLNVSFTEQFKGDKDSYTFHITEKR